MTKKEEVKRLEKFIEKSPLKKGEGLLVEYLREKGTDKFKEYLLEIPGEEDYPNTSEERITDFFLSTFPPNSPSLEGKTLEEIFLLALKN